jgi:hypothetical protein
MKANELIGIGRNRNCAPSSEASRTGSPSRSCLVRANSMTGIAFFAASPIMPGRPAGNIENNRSTAHKLLETRGNRKS